MLLEKNSFWILQSSPMDSNASLKSKLDNLIQEQPAKAEKLTKYYHRLTRSKLRVLEEVGWFSDLPKAKINDVMAGAKVETGNNIDNLLMLLHGLKNITASEAFGQALFKIGQIYEETTIASLLDRINENREIAGFEPLATENEVSIAWQKMGEELVQISIDLANGNGLAFYGEVLAYLGTHSDKVMDNPLWAEFVKGYVNNVHKLNNESARIKELLVALQKPDFASLEELDNLLVNWKTLVKPIELVNPQGKEIGDEYFQSLLDLVELYIKGDELIYARGLLELMFALYDYKGSRYEALIPRLRIVLEDTKLKIKENLQATTEILPVAVEEATAGSTEVSEEQERVNDNIPSPELGAETEAETGEIAAQIEVKPEDIEDKDVDISAETSESLAKNNLVNNAIGEELAQSEIKTPEQISESTQKDNMPTNSIAQEVAEPEGRLQKEIAKPTPKNNLAANVIATDKDEPKIETSEVTTETVATKPTEKSQHGEKNKKPLLIGVAAIVCLCFIGGIGYSFYAKHQATTKIEQEQKQEQEAADKQPIGDYAQAVNQFSLAGLSVGDDKEKMVSILGNAKDVKRVDGEKCYVYPDMDVYVDRGMITQLVSNSDLVYTKKGIHQGDSLQKVMDTYGDENLRISDYKGYKLYEYEFPSVNHIMGILRFVVNKNNKVAYISARVEPEWYKEKMAQMPMDEDVSDGTQAVAPTEQKPETKQAQATTNTKPQAKPQPKPSVSPGAAKAAAIAAVQRYYGSGNGVQVSGFSVNSVSGNSVVLSFTVTKRVSVGYGKFKGESGRYTAEVVNTGSGWQVSSIY